MLRLISSAKARADIVRDLNDKSRILLRHLISYFLFPDSDASSHWKEEIAKNFIDYLPPAKGSHRRLSPESVFNILWTSIEDEFNDLVYLEVSEHADLEPRLGRRRLYEACKTYLHWLSGELSAKGSAPTTRVYAKLDAITQSLSQS